MNKILQIIWDRIGVGGLIIILIFVYAIGLGFVIKSSWDDAEVERQIEQLKKER